VTVILLKKVKSIYRRVHE